MWERPSQKVIRRPNEPVLNLPRERWQLAFARIAEVEVTDINRLDFDSPWALHLGITSKDQLQSYKNRNSARSTTRRSRQVIKASRNRPFSRNDFEIA